MKELLGMAAILGLVASCNYIPAENTSEKPDLPPFNPDHIRQVPGDMHRVEVNSKEAVRAVIVVCEMNSGRVDHNALNRFIITTNDPECAKTVKASLPTPTIAPNRTPRPTPILRPDGSGY